MKYCAITIEFMKFISNCILSLLVSHSSHVFAHKNIAIACYVSHLWE